jgi:hypothetical protein
MALLKPPRYKGSNEKQKKQQHNQRKSFLVSPLKTKPKNKADLTDGNVELSRSVRRYKQKSKERNK